MIRHAQSRRRVSSECVQLQERRHHPWKCALYPSFTHRHWRFSQTFQLSYLFHTRRASEGAQNNENDPAPFKSLGCAQMIGNDDSTPITRSTLFTAHRQSRCDSPKANHNPTPKSDLSPRTLCYPQNRVPYSPPALPVHDSDKHNLVRPEKGFRTDALHGGDCLDSYCGFPRPRNRDHRGSQQSTSVSAPSRIGRGLGGRKQHQLHHFSALPPHGCRVLSPPLQGSHEPSHLQGVVYEHVVSISDSHLLGSFSSPRSPTAL